MSLTPEERREGLEAAKAAGFEKCPDCGDEIHAYDAGVPPGPGSILQSGAYVMCDACGWAWPPEDTDDEVCACRTCRHYREVNAALQAEAADGE